MPWYLGASTGDEEGCYWITVHNNSLSKLFEEIDTNIEKEIPSGCDVRIGSKVGLSPESPVALAPSSYLLSFSEMDDGTFQWQITLKVIKPTYDEHSKNFYNTVYRYMTTKQHH